MNQENSATPLAATNALERRIDLAVSLADIEKEVGQRLRKLSRTAKMPGFRPGKVPMKMVEQQYGSQARSEALGAAVEKAFGASVREQQLRVAGYPRIEPQEGGGSGAELRFSAVFEVYPQVVIGDLAGQRIERATCAVGDAEVDRTIEVLRKQRTTYHAAGRPAAVGDRLVIDFTGRKGGEPFPGGAAEDHALLLGGGSMLGDFEAALQGMSAGEGKTFDLVFPADYHVAELAGQTVQFEVAVKAVEAPRVPELDGDFAKSLGIADGDLVKMRAEVRTNLEREVKKRLQARVKNQVMEALIAVTPVEVPKSLVDMEARDMAEKARRDFESRGLANQKFPVEPAWFTEGATRRVRLGLIMAELVKVQNLAATSQQVRAVVDEFSETFEDPAEVVRWYYSQPQRLAEAEALAVESNVVDWVLGHAAAVDTPVSFDDLMGNAA